MDSQFFKNQIKRLQDVYRETSYPPERVNLIWNAFRNTFDAVFKEAIDDLISSKRSAPMLPEMLEAVDICVNRDKERRLQTQQVITGQDVLTQIKATAKIAPNKDFAQVCIKLLEDYKTGKLNKKQFIEGCDFLDTTAKKISESRQCIKCNKSGYVLRPNETGYEFLYRCDCLAGQRMPEKLLGPLGKNGERNETLIQIWRQS